MDIIVTQHETTGEWIVVATGTGWKSRSTKQTLEQALSETVVNLEVLLEKHQNATAQIKRALDNVKEKNLTMLKGDLEFYEFASRSHLIQQWLSGERDGDTIYCVIDGNGVWQDTQSDFEGALYFSEYHESPSIVTAKMLYLIWKGGLIS